MKIKTKMIIIIRARKIEKQKFVFREKGGEYNVHLCNVTYSSIIFLARTGFTKLHTHCLLSSKAASSEVISPFRPL